MFCWPQSVIIFIVSHDLTLEGEGLGKLARDPGQSGGVGHGSWVLPSYHFPFCLCLLRCTYGVGKRKPSTVRLSHLKNWRKQNHQQKAKRLVQAITHYNWMRLIIAEINTFSYLNGLTQRKFLWYLLLRVPGESSLLWMMFRKPGSFNHMG